MEAKKEITGYPSIDKPWLKYYSEEAINTPFPACTAYDYVRKSNMEDLDHVALNYMGKKITYRGLFSRIKKTAAAFSAIGIKKGDVVVICSVSTPETVYAFFALDRLGAISNMVDPRTSVEGIREYILETDAEVVLTLDVAYPKIAEAIEETNVRKIIVTSPADSLPTGKKELYNLAERLKGKKVKYSSLCMTWREFICDGKDVKINYARYEKDTCCLIVHTGGTTGTPKGVMLSNDNLNAMVFQSIHTDTDMKPDQSWLDIMPPFIAYGIGMGLCLPLIIGMEVILIPKFDPEKFDELLLKYKDRQLNTSIVPSYWNYIINSPKLKHQDMSFIHIPAVGGDSMDVELEKEANQFLKDHNSDWHIIKGYGMSEVCAAVTGCSRTVNAPGSVGAPFVKTIIKIIDPYTGKELPYYEKGEVCICSPNIMLGYYHKEAETNAVIQKHSDGLTWMHSGDIGYINEDGLVFIVDRIKRIIVRHDGFKVFPSMIEDAVSAYPVVAQCCAVGAADEDHRQGKLPVVHVVLKDEFKGREEQIREELTELCAKELPEYAQPVGWYFRESMPLTPIGKVDYRLLEEASLLNEG